MKLQIPRASTKQSPQLATIIQGGLHKTHRNGNVCLHGVPHIQQGSPNGCLDACQEMLLQHFDCDGAYYSGMRHKSGVDIMPDTGRSLTIGHQLKSISWLQKNLLKDPGALSLVTKSVEQTLEVETVPQNISAKALSRLQ